MPRRKITHAGQRRVRMRDVAHNAGVSPMTVSRALKHPEKVSPELREKVEQAAREIGYVPNLLAGSLSSARSTTIGLVVPSLENSIYALTLEGLSRVFSGAGFQLMIAETGNSRETEARIVDTMLSYQVAALVLHDAEHSSATRDKLRRSAIPVVEIGNIPHDPIDSVVSYSNRDAAFEMTMHLGRRGYRHIAFASLRTQDNDRSRARLEGYLGALETLGLKRDPGLIVESQRGLSAGADVVTHFIQTFPEVDALFCAGDVLCAGALLECKRRGWNVPGRIALAGFDDVELMAHLSPALTVVRLPRREIGERAARLLLDRVLGGEAAGAQDRVIDLKFDIVQRDST